MNKIVACVTLADKLGLEVHAGHGLDYKTTKLLTKIKSIVSKNISNECIKTILVLDGTNGSNMVNQVETFGNSMDVNSLIITNV